MAGPRTHDNGRAASDVELPDADAVAAVAPDMRALAAVGTFGASCFAVLDGGARVKTRMFGPAPGRPSRIRRVRVGGRALLALHLARHGRTAFGQTVEIHQGAEIGRPSVLERAAAEGSAESVVRVVVGGGAVIVARGEYRLS